MEKILISLLIEVVQRATPELLDKLETLAMQTKNPYDDFLVLIIQLLLKEEK